MDQMLQTTDDSELVEPGAPRRPRGVPAPGRAPLRHASTGSPTASSDRQPTRRTSRRTSASCWRRNSSNFARPQPLHDLAHEHRHQCLPGFPAAAKILAGAGREIRGAAGDRRGGAGRSGGARRLAERCAASLEPSLRETVVLVVAEELSHAEAAEILGCAESTVSWRMHMARKRLRELMDKTDG